MKETDQFKRSNHKHDSPGPVGSDDAAQRVGGGVPVSVSNLVKHFGDVPAVNGLSFEAEPASTVSLLGPSGCGKTTTLRCIAGLEAPESGRITIGDHVVYDGGGGILVEPEKRHIGMVFQSYAIWPHMTVAGNVGFPLQVEKRPRREIGERVDRVLALVGLSELSGRAASDLSGGQQQRVALARALIYEPRVVLFDEPLSNLDADLRERMRSELKLLQETLEFTAIYVTHDQQEALALSDTIILMRDGRIEQKGSPEEVFRDPRSLFTARFLGYSNQFAGKVTAVDGGRTVTIELKEGPSLSAVWNSEDPPHLNEPAVVAIRRDRIALYPAGQAASGGGYGGRIDVASFLGTHVNYIVSVDGLRCRVEAPVDRVFSRGDHVLVGFLPDHCHAYRPD